MRVAEKNRILIKNCGKAFLYALVLFLGHLINLMQPLSLFHINFKAITLFSPVFAGFFSVPFVIGTFGLLALLKMVSFCFFKTPLFVSFGLPLLVGSLAWRESLSRRFSAMGFVAHVCIPLFAMAAFIVHPVSRPAFAYSLYWLIPVCFYSAARCGIMKNVSEFFYLYCAALASTFITHALGASIYLFTIPSSTSLWLSLISVVPLERGLIALGIVALYGGVCYVKSVCKRFKLAQ